MAEGTKRITGKLIAREDDNPAMSTRRRVYDLPVELVDRIVDFQADRGFPSEVEAVRRLLVLALNSRDTLETLLVRYFSALGPGVEPIDAAREVLVGHPSVSSISFDDNGGVRFIFSKKGEASQHVHPAFPGQIFITETVGYGSSTETLIYALNMAKPPNMRLELVDKNEFLGSVSSDDD